MKHDFTFIFALATIICTMPVNAQNEQLTGQMKPEIRKMELVDYPLQLRSSEIETRADVKPFPDSTVTYNLKGEQIRKAFYKYDTRGKQTSYIEYTRREGTNNWYESSKQTTTYNSAGDYLSDESYNWDDAKQIWIGSWKDVYAYNSSGQQVSYEYYTWDSQSNTWKGSSKSTTDYQTGNRRVTSYEWDATAKDWVLNERNEYVSETVRYCEWWYLNAWGTPIKIESKRVVNYDKLGVRITIDEERLVWKDNAGKWDENTAVIYIRAGLQNWSAWNYVSYNISYDNAQNITSVTLTSYGDSKFTTSFTYDYTVNKMNSFKVYMNNELVDNYSLVYDNLGRTIEQSRNLNNNSDVYDNKYAYTYIGESDVYNSTEYYLWDNSKKVFVKERKNMYTRNADGTVVMYQTYSWAETKWVLSSYTIYYPNEYTSDLEFEETAPVGSSNKGTFEVGFNLPQDADVTGSFYITFPSGFVLDEANTVLSDALSSKYTMTITQQEAKNTWFVEIKEIATRSLSTYGALPYKKILTVAFSVDDETKKGDYKAEITNLNFLLTDGTILIEQKRDVTITVERYGVANEPTAADKINVFASGEQLTVDTPDRETIIVYSINGEKIYSSSKTAGKYTISVNGWKPGIYFVTGSKGWAAKLLIQ